FDERSSGRAENVGDRRNLVVVEVEGALNDPETYANPMVHPLLKRLLGEHHIVGQYGSVTSLPGAADQPLHRDSKWLYGDPAVDLSLPAYAITVVIPLVDMHVDHAGTTRVWPGTHHVASDEESARMAHVDPVLPKGSCLLMDCRLIHGGTGNRSTAPRPILYMSYQRRWFRDYDGYRVKPPIHISDAEFKRIPREHQEMFAWARADNTPETVQLAARRLLRRVVPEKVKGLLRG
ncbi:MAG TPA: phytanoyl-CoA dioxygenase family protein, partial [Vicinamibacterales bacterium]